MAKIVLIAIGVVIFLICVAVGLQSCARSGKQDAGSETSTEETTTEPETEIEAEITVNGIQIHGLTKSEAMEKVLADMGWKMKVTFGDSTEELPNLMEANVDAVIEEALAKKESGDYTVQTDDTQPYHRKRIQTSGCGLQRRCGSGAGRRCLPGILNSLQCGRICRTQDDGTPCTHI